MFITYELGNPLLDAKKITNDWSFFVGKHVEV